jgi:hypothetical protein
MQTMRAYRHIGLFAAVAVLAAAATPALAVDNDGASVKDKKAAAAEHKTKSQKAKEGSTMSKETAPAYPNLGAPTGY